MNDEKNRVLDGDAKDENLVIRELRKTYKGRATPAVDGVSIGVPASQCFGLLGINGAGKTTLFRMLTRSLLRRIHTNDLLIGMSIKIYSSFEPATEGDAWLGGVDLLKKRQGWQRFSQASYCPQENALFPKLTAKQHLEMHGAIRGIPSSARKQLTESLIVELGLTAHKDKTASQLSGGNQRKLQLAMALMDYPKVIFLDEPSSGMDPGARRDAWEAIKRAADAGCSVVLTSHSMDECEALCQRLVS